MTYYWIIPGNLKIFRITDYFSNNDIVDWKQSHYKFSVGDIVFLYVSSPISSIRYMLEVIKTDIPFEESIKDGEYWTSEHPVAEEVRSYNYVRLKLLKKSIVRLCILMLFQRLALKLHKVLHAGLHLSK